MQIINVMLASLSALTEFTLDAVAAFQGCVQAGDGVGVAHAVKMRRRPGNRESSGVVPDLSPDALRCPGTTEGFQNTPGRPRMTWHGPPKPLQAHRFTLGWVLEQDAIIDPIR